MDTSLVGRVQQIITDSGLSQRDFAERMSIDDTKLSKSLKGTRKFSSLELAQIAQIGGRTVDWLLTGLPPKNFQFAARNNGATSLLDDHTATELLEEVSDRFEALEALGLSPVTPELPKVPRRRRYLDEANALAESALTQLQVSVSTAETPELVNAIESTFGINIIVEHLPDDLDGLSYQDDGFRVIILDPTDNASRQRFTLAHELAHILFRDAEEKLLAERMWVKTSEHQRESRADAFAASFLMPESEARQSIGNADPIEAFDELVWRFQLSPSATAWRLLNLGIIDDDSRETLGRRTTSTVARRLAKQTELAMRAESSQRLRKPWLLVNAYLDAYTRGEVTLRPIASLLGWSLAQAEQYFGDSVDAATDDYEAFGN